AERSSRGPRQVLCRWARVRDPAPSRSWAAGAVDSPRRCRVRRFAVPAGPGAGLLRRIAVAATWHRRRPQRLLAVHPAGRTNWPVTLGQPQGTLSQYVNLQALKTLLQASVTATATTPSSRPGRR